MTSAVRFGHVNIIARDWRALSAFYEQALGCTREGAGPERDLSGNWLDRATSIKNAHITGIHLILPGYEENLPTLEIFQYEKNEENPNARTNRKGFGHIAFKVDDVQEILKKVLLNGGIQVGELVESEIKNAGTVTFVYVRDIDGNIIELQSWKK